jgi:hypothetical protein
MMDDGVKEKGADEQVKVSDISMILLEAVESIPGHVPTTAPAVPAAPVES